MQVVALPGRRSETEGWLRAVLLAAGLPDSGLVRYRHWSSDAEASVSFEAAQLAGQTPQLVVAKSLGTIIAATAFGKHGFRPAAAVLIGTPFQAAAPEDLRLLREFARGVETLFIQQAEDPGGPAAALHDDLELARGDVATVPGNDHLYSDVPGLVDALRPWWNQRAKRRIASCSCGQLQISVSGPPLRISICHCLACQQRTGSAFGFQARFHQHTSQVTGDSSEFVRIGDAGGRATFHFCPKCGATVFYKLDGNPDVVAVPVGAFADPGFPAPWFSVYEERMHAWLGLPDDMEHMD